MWDGIILLNGKTGINKYIFQILQTPEFVFEFWKGLDPIYGIWLTPHWKNIQAHSQNWDSGMSNHMK